MDDKEHTFMNNDALIDFGNNLIKLKKFVKLSDLNVVYKDYLLELEKIGEEIRPVNEFKSNSSGFFYINGTKFLSTPIETIPVHEIYANNGHIKFSRFYHHKHNSTFAHDTYFNDNIYTTILFELKSKFLDDELKYPNLKFGELLIHTDQMDLLDNMFNNNVNNQSENDGFDYDDFDDYYDDYYDSYTELHGGKSPREVDHYSLFDSRIIYAKQCLNHQIGNYLQAFTIHDTNENFKLLLTNNLNNILSEKYKVGNPKLLELDTNLGFDDVQSIDQILREETNQKNILGFLTYIFKDCDAKIMEINKNSKKIMFPKAISLLNYI
jgi:hypothetical protein